MGLAVAPGTQRVRTLMGGSAASNRSPRYPVPWTLNPNLHRAGTALQPWSGHEKTRSAPPTPPLTTLQTNGLDEKLPTAVGVEPSLDRRR